VKGFRLLRHQFAFEERRLWRDPAGVFFAAAFPVIFLFVFLTILGKHEEAGTVAGHSLASANYYLPSVLVLAMVSANFVNLPVSLTASRERGVLKRLRGTPLPPWIFLTARALTALGMTFLLVVLTVTVGFVFYGISLPLHTLPAALLTLILGTLSLCALGFALTTVTRSEGAAAALASLIAFPLYFISGLFARLDVIPSSVREVAAYFPVNRIFTSLAIAFDPAASGSGLRGWDLLVICLWGVGGALIALRFFRWTPRSG
jgi:ABC-2 type transport system permease protein